MIDPLVAGPEELGEVDLALLVARARDLCRHGRAIVGIAGAPGSGKSTLTRSLLPALGPTTAVVEMDGFHLASNELKRLGLEDEKGSPRTFDSVGFSELIRRLSLRGAEAVYAPRFHRELEEAIAGSTRVGTEIDLILVDGNYLLLDQTPWSTAHEFFSEVWFCEIPERQRLSQLVERHLRYGKTRAEAEAWSHGPDQANAHLVAQSRHRADAVFTLRSSSSRAQTSPAP